MSRKYTPEYYECFGLPGSGKTTFCNNLSMLTLQKVINEKSYSHFNNALCTARAIFKNYKVVFSIVLLMAKFPSLFNFGSCSYLLRLPTQREKLKLSLASARPLLSEQFLLQNLWSALIRVDGGFRGSAQDISPLIRALYEDISGRVILFHCVPSVAKARIMGRSKNTGRFDAYTGESLTKALRQGSSIIQIIVEGAEIAGMDVIFVNANQKLDFVLRDAKRVIERSYFF